MQDNQSHKICLVLEGFEEYFYFEKILQFPCFPKNKYTIKPINAKSASNVPGIYQEEFQKNIPLFMNKAKEGKEALRERYISFCLSARDLISEQRKKSSTQLCDKAREIIEKNYMNQDLSLGYVSNEIAVSPNYLSALIKKATGSTFVDLLSQKRIEVAKELLMCTDMKIREIAEKCGYSDQHYFSYCFKKYTGMSPNACRGK